MPSDPKSVAGGLHALLVGVSMAAVLLGLVGAQSLRAQTLTQEIFSEVGLQSPNAASLGKYGDVPVSLYRGTPEISVPLYEVEARTHKLPVRLRYHASGAKPQELPSWVGQGWTLEAGGVITRTMRGQPDEASRGYLDQRDELIDFLEEHSYNVEAFDFGGNQNTFDRDDWTYLDNVAQGRDDAEPDQFFFNVAGLTGRFVFNEDPQADEQVVMTSQGQSVRVEYDVSDGDIQEWRLRGPDGTRYVFGETEVDYGGSNVLPYVSSWHLTEIIPAGGDDSIQLGYVKGGEVVTQDPPFAEVRKSEIKGNTGVGCTSRTSWSRYERSFSYKPQYLSFIETGRERIEFVSSPRQQGRTDERKLDEIQVLRSGKVLKRFEFAYGYFEHPSGAQRLKLEEVQEKGPEQSSAAAGPHVFTYNESEVLPAFDSKALDHWGFYNGADHNSSLMPSVEFDGETYAGSADRTPSEAHAKAGVLKEIQYPTGGSTTFHYELHAYGQVGRMEESGQAGGLRIQKIVNDPAGGGPLEVKRYEYELSNGRSSGVLVAEPVYARKIDYYQCEGTGEVLDLVRCPYLYRKASSFVPLGTSAGGHVGYRQVTVYREAEDTLNRVVHEFNATRSGPEERWPRVPLPHRQWNHGEKLATRFYDGSGQLLRKVDVSYAVDRSGPPAVHGLRANQAGEGKTGTSAGSHCTTNYRANDYVVRAGWRRRTQRREVHYGAEGDSLEVTESYHYRPETRQVRTRTKTTSNGPGRSTRFEYAHEEYPRMGPDGTHQLSQKYRTTVFQDANGNGEIGFEEKVLRRRWTKWKEHEDWSIDGFVPEGEWVWTGE